MFTPSGWPFHTIVFAAAAAALVFAPLAPAAPAPAYEELVRLLDQAPATLEAEALFEAASGRAQQARALPNPTISLDADNAYGSSPYSGYEGAETTFSVSQPLELWGQRGARIGAAEAEAKAASLRRDQSLSAVAGRLALIYAEAETSSLQHELAVEALSLTQADADAVMALVKAGREAELRGVQAESEVEAARAVADETLANRNAAFARLAAVANLTEPVTSIDTSLLDRTPKPFMSDGVNPLGVRVAEAELAAAGRYVNVERLRARPDVSASLGVTRYEEYESQAFSFGISVSVPLFDRNKGAISAARAEQRAAEARLASLKLEARADRSAAQAQLEAAVARTRAADKGVTAAEEAYRLARVGFDAGRISQLELRSIRSDLIAARNTSVESRLARVRAAVELARLDGRTPF
ncbi:outer membrane protein, cobalt-zinc-cadmium efflux system [Halopseudomonas litoralis]|uniref:Outer membrane protein, cobalt-zinc-cadmium efflux system n=1 Tax=Halopseudomonas litoralis TaxID=797277 RepID=A0A1H1QY21_9GAMM|nr:TolC family protein [Halopseudomonas litoralis]SDS28252.1 outer membrane protein, cobalt-zinc-cadmium efflux system [Halopseudomonas litoralis]